VITEYVHPCQVHQSPAPTYPRNILRKSPITRSGPSSKYPPKIIYITNHQLKVQPKELQKIFLFVKH